MQRLGFHNITWTKLVSASMCVIALSVFLSVSSGPAKAQAGGGCGPCSYGTGTYSQGACLPNGQMCKCGGTAANPEPYFQTDESCPQC